MSELIAEGPLNPFSTTQHWSGNRLSSSAECSRWGTRTATSSTGQATRWWWWWWWWWL